MREYNYVTDEVKFLKKTSTPEEIKAYLASAIDLMQMYNEITEFDFEIFDKYLEKNKKFFAKLSIEDLFSIFHFDFFPYGVIYDLYDAVDDLYKLETPSLDEEKILSLVEAFTEGNFENMTESKMKTELFWVVEELIKIKNKK